MAKLSIKSEKITPFGGIFHVRELFSRYVDPVIDKVLGLRCTSYGYQYSEIAGSLSSVYFCGGDCVEDVTSHLMPHLSLHPTLRTCSSDTILRGISELATVNTTYTSDTGKSYDFNTATKLNSEAEQPAGEGTQEYWPAYGRRVIRPGLRPPVHRDGEVRCEDDLQEVHGLQPRRGSHR